MNEPTTPVSEPSSRAFKFCPRCGSPPTSTNGANPFCCGSCDFTHYFSPITAVGSIIADPQSRVLLIVRGRDPGKGQFGLPGGFVDPGETLESACRREMREETNLTATSMQYLTSFPNTYDFRGVISPVTDAFFVCRVESFEPLQAQQGEVTSCLFVHPEQTHLDNMAFASNRLALEFYLSREADFA